MVLANLFAQAAEPTTYTYTTYTYTSTNSGVSSGALITILLIALVVSIVGIVALWKVFQKAGKPGWAAIVPVYSVWVLFEITGFPGWLALLMFIPFVNFAFVIVLLITYFKLAKAFGKSDGFAVLTVFFSFICLLILGFGKAQYQGVDGGKAKPQAPVAQ